MNDASDLATMNVLVALHTNNTSRSAQTSYLAGRNVPLLASSEIHVHVLSFPEVSIVYVMLSPFLCSFYVQSYKIINCICAHCARISNEKPADLPPQHQIVVP